MKHAISTMLAAVLLVGGAADAQTQPTNPLDKVPDKMPFATPYGPPISLQQAQSVIQAAMNEATKHGWPENFAVVDSGANLVAFVRMDGSLLASIPIAQHKARTAVLFRRPTRAFEVGLQLRPVAGWRDRLAGRRSVDRGRQDHRRHRLLRRYWVAG